MTAAPLSIARLLDAPLCSPGDLGAPIPPSPYAVSVCLPTWRDNVGYEEGEPRVVDRLQAGYPRFVFHPLCRRLFEECRRRFARDDEGCLAFPTRASAERCGAWIERRTGLAARIEATGFADVQAVLFAPRCAAEAKAFWQHTGEGVTSRVAEAAWGAMVSEPCADEGEGGRRGEGVRGRRGEGEKRHGGSTPSPPHAFAPSPPLPTASREAGPKPLLRERLAFLTGVAPDDVFLFPCGMNAAWRLHRAILTLFPDRRSAQFGFPYVDTLKILEKTGAGGAFFPRGDGDDLAGLDRLMARERLAAIYTEFPSNPLLLSPDLESLARLARRHETPLIIDDTVASCLNVDVLQVADIAWMSLTKYFSGVGDATGGAAVVNPGSPFASALRDALRREDDLLSDLDADVLERNSRDFTSRMARINANTELLADHLQRHPRVARVHFPKFSTPERYRAFQRPGGGYGGLLSIELRDAPVAAPRFFDALRVCKGPNLGMAYTLACPYTILAHYGELDFAERCGVSRHLVRVSVGTEDPHDLVDRFDAALV